jgi:hypothetical protein
LSFDWFPITHCPARDMQRVRGLVTTSSAVYEF